jgi:preprotein translocase subunit YajC
MTSKQDSKPSAATPPPPFALGDVVITPSGRHAEVIVVYPDKALVQWTDGHRAEFRLSLLKLVPKKEA